MKYWYILVLSLLGVLGFAQSEIKVFKAGNRTPIAGASVACNGKILGRTNAAGILKFRTQCRSVEVAAKGYYETEVVVDKVMEATLEQLEKGTASIEKVVLKDVSDPKALELLKKVRAHYSDNTPQSLPSYSFKAYEKTALDLDQDTIQQYNDFVKARLDSLKQLPQKNQNPKKIKDSIENTHTMKLMGQSKAFLWERVKEFAYSKKYGEKITVLDNRVSGLNNPIYEMLTLRSNRTKMPREILEENQKLYRYFLTDTLDVEGRPSYVIRFRQTNYKQRENRRKYNGYLYIDAETYGLKKIESSSNKKNEGSLTSIWTLVDGKWFLQKENLKLKAGQISFKQNKEEKNNKKQEYGYYVYHIADYFDYQTNFEAKAKDFKGYTMEIKNADGSLLSQYRTDSLSQRDLMTYTKIDSVGQKYQLDRKVKLVSALLGGKLRLGKVDFNLGNAIKYTLYEGLRLGAEVKMNEKFHRYLSPDAYVAYGFKDRGLKYGLGLDVKTTLRKTSFFRIEYYHDVLAAGKFNERLWNFKMKIMNGGVNLKNDRFYQYEGVKLSYENDLLNSLTLRTSVARNVEQALFNYDYRGMGNQFDNFKTIVTLKYAPKSKNIMTPSGKYTFEQGFPEFYFNFEKADKAFGGDFDYTKMDILATHRFKTKVGITGARVYSGIVTGEAPIWHLFHMNGLGGRSSNLNYNYNLTSYLGFATMQAGKYYSDRMLGYYLTHRLPWHFKSFGQQTSSFDLVYRGAIGSMKHPERHQFDFSTLNRLYQEAGFEWNNFLSTGLNLGFFYRVGHYQTPKFGDNFAVQLKVKLLGF